MHSMSTIAPTQDLTVAGTWAADPVHSNVSFAISYAGTNTFKGGFREFSATLSNGTLEGSAKVARVDVKGEQLNVHPQTPYFFDSERLSAMAFQPTSLENGELT